MIDKLKQIPFIRKLNRYRPMPVIWWSILVVVLPLIFSLLQVLTIWRVGLLFVIFNSAVSYHVGNLIKSINLKRPWLFFLPASFCLLVLLKYADYNLLFGLIYLIFEIFGLMDKQIYN